MTGTKKGGSIAIPELSKLAVPIGLKLAEQNIQQMLKKTSSGGSLEKLAVPFGLLTTGKYVSDKKLVSKTANEFPKLPLVGGNKGGNNVVQSLAVPLGLYAIKDKSVDLLNKVTKSTRSAVTSGVTASLSKSSRSPKKGGGSCGSQPASVQQAGAKKGGGSCGSHTASVQQAGAKKGGGSCGSSIQTAGGKKKKKSRYSKK